ncbi:hypothetical protein Droror1_Dr00020518 [Drosera rotundifolia]
MEHDENNSRDLSVVFVSCSLDPSTPECRRGWCEFWTGTTLEAKTHPLDVAYLSAAGLTSQVVDCELKLETSKLRGTTLEAETHPLDVAYLSAAGLTSQVVDCELKLETSKLRGKLGSGVTDVMRCIWKLR